MKTILDICELEGFSNEDRGRVINVANFQETVASNNSCFNLFAEILFFVLACLVVSLSLKKN